MDFRLSEDEGAVQGAAREFSDSVLKPIAGKIDHDHRIPDAVYKQLAELGFLGIMIPKEFGGSGMSNVMASLILMELARACASTCVMTSVHNSLVCTPLNKFGDDFQKRKYLPQLAEGRVIGAYSLSEPSSGTDAGSLCSTAVRTGSQYVLNGQKVFVTNGGEAGLFIIFARTHPDASLGPKGVSAFIVERDSKGLTVGKPEKKMGIRGSTTVTLYLEDLKVPAENLLGKENEGFKIAMDTLNGGRIGIGSQAVGIAVASLEASVKYAKERTQFGKPIAEYEAIQWKIARMAADIDAARLLVLQAAFLRDAGLPHIKECSEAKLFASRIANEAATQAVQVHGGAGYTVDFPVERYFRDAKVTEIYEGTTEVQHIVISRQLLR